MRIGRLVGVLLAVVVVAAACGGGRTVATGVGAPTTTVVTSKACACAAEQTGRGALEVWGAFPAAERPRPVVPLDGTVNIPPLTVATQPLFASGFFALRAALPATPISHGVYPLNSARAAYRELRGQTPTEVPNPNRLTVVSVRFGTARFETDRGRVLLPAWKFFLRGVPDPATVLAVASSLVYRPPAPQRYSSGVRAQRATLSATGTDLTIHLIGAPAGTGACDANYSATAAAATHAVAVAIHTITSGKHSPNGLCVLGGFQRQVTVHLAQPLGDRVLIDSTDSSPIPVGPAP